MAKFEHNGTAYELRCDVLAISETEAATDYRLEKMGSGGVVEVATWVYFFAKRGEEHAGRVWDFDLVQWLGAIEMSDIEPLSAAVADLLDLGGDKKKKPESP